MATYTTGDTIAFNSENFWVENTGVSSNERFEGLISSSAPLGGVLGSLIGTRTQTFSELVFESNGLTYRYIGNWTITADANVLVYDISAEGSYSEIRV